jgi:hypothetical protein
MSGCRWFDSQDCVVVVTGGDGFDFDAIATYSRLVIDTRGAVRDDGPEHN